MFADARLIEPLDVVLSGAKATGSALIRHTTAGMYSHAALLVEDALLFEAAPHGVGYRPVDLDLSSDPYSFIEAKYLTVLRHPVIEKLPQSRYSELREDAAKLCRELVGKRYAAFPQLAVLARRKWTRRLVEAAPGVPAAVLKAASVLGTVKHVVRSPRHWRIALLQASTDDDPGSRFYCSGMVAHVFDQLGLPVVRPLLSSGVTPSELLDPEFSILRAVPITVDRIRLRTDFSNFSGEIRRIEKEAARAIEASLVAAHSMFHEMQRAPDVSDLQSRRLQIVSPALWEVVCHVAESRRAVERLCNLGVNLRALLHNGSGKDPMIQSWLRVVFSHLEISQYPTPPLQTLQSLGGEDQRIAGVNERLAQTHEAYASALATCRKLAACLKLAGGEQA